MKFEANSVSGSGDGAQPASCPHTTEAFVRPDGREHAQELRPLSVQLGFAKTADGSARVSQGLTSVIALVVGPVEAPPGKFSSSGCVFHVILKPLAVPPTLSAARAAAAMGSCSAVAGAGGGRKGRTGGDSGEAFERWIEVQLQTLLQHMVAPGEYPRCLIQLTLMILQDDGGAESACINAALAALIDAGVALRFRAWAASLVRLSRGARALERSEERPAVTGSALSPASQAGSRCEGQQSSGAGDEDGEWRVDPCSEEEDGRKEGAICLVLEPQTGDLVSSFFERSVGSSAAHGARASRVSRSGLAVAGAGHASPCGGWWAIGRGGSEESSDTRACLMLALSACRFVDSRVRAAFRAKMETPCNMFRYNNFWWRGTDDEDIEGE
ncbi:putative 3' exoribonuclease family, domain 1 containing protein [Neospora caninum Liverpool]|uniref:3' exoribonuclease family, domain 1 containing protein, putative n=1 Tax=Neospora caninum (strain Liverpool) TaxID=572307 RepID=F0VB81_NEOCL|nr:putative 3' exoribonuclease family, domain 1 containing protein [Neospora caninum Liverpool]CBZ51418.1 putative 3' exoribonuclease family, domain 1 containing protein [Neospora caninum Liverpool]CEL68738.1 TPA: 3' exoribonuclease family, domain 1 containing protein, putative [Neospora caninum Liverpool]|eukprot:XP_003881451.1 putative 3' exoribonuclease family, domain 1 containing protein [Neospora caninum Liverpool]